MEEKQSPQFLPSEKLVALVVDNAVEPLHRETLVKVQESAKRTDGGLMDLNAVRNRIGETLEGLLANLANRAAVESTNPVVISEDNRFKPAVCDELLYRLGQDAYGARPVLSKFHEELVQYAGDTRMRRFWGELVAAPRGLKLWANKNAAGPQIDLDQGAWNVVK